MKHKFISLLVTCVAWLFASTSQTSAQANPSKCVSLISKRLEAVGTADFDFNKARQIIKEFDFGKASEFVNDGGKRLAFQRIFTSMSEFIDLAPNDISGKGMRGYTRFSGGIIRATGADFVDDLKQIFGPPLPAFDGVGFSRVMEYLDSNGTWINQTRWQSKGGQLFFDSGSQQGHRISHLLTHTQPGYKPAPHSVFSGMRDQMFDLLDEGWNKPPSARVQGLRADGSPDPIAWVVDLGKVVGTGGQTKIRYVIKSGTTGDLISAYPVFDLMP